MGTSYYGLRLPVTSVRPEVKGGHTHLGIWVNHAKAGEIVLRNEELVPFLSLLYDSDSECVMHSHWGGSEVGTIVTGGEEERSDRQLISEYGECMTVEEIRARHGAKRKDGMPTELLGFEK